MDIKVINEDSKIKISDDIFGCKYNEALIHQVVTSYLTNQRSGTRAQKNRSAVSGGGAKPWRQKGTGRARAGTIRSPLFRTGGVTFAAKSKIYNKKVNKKAYKVAIKSILSELIKQKRFNVVNVLSIKEPKTKIAQEMLKKIITDTDKKILLIQSEIDSNLYLGIRNIPKISCIDVSAINPVDLVYAENIIIEKDAIKLLEKRLES
ncbi:MAG: 50S ribosomal protein L4 [Gammaproteobacteria bacterium]|nr:MAG: 50S ribosomal protein L4 [Gammaproteobacteria bacterium]